MFKKIREIPFGGNKFIISEDYLVLVDKKARRVDFFDKGNLNLINQISGYRINNYFQFDDKEYFIDNSSNLLVKNGSLKKVEIPHENSILSIDNLPYLVTFKRDKNSYSDVKVSILDFSTGNFLIDFDFRIRYLVKSKKYLLVDRVDFKTGLVNELYGFNIHSNSNIWRLSIREEGKYSDENGNSKQGEVKKILGVYNNIFWVAITNHKVIGIDISTGEIKHNLRDIPDFHCAWLPSAIPDPYGMQMDEMNGKIIGFRWEFYWEIDLKQEEPEIKLYDLTEYFNELKLRSTLAEYVLTDEYIYFSEFEKGKIGVLNRETKKVDWLHRMEHIKDDSLNLTIRKIDYQNNRLFVLDSEGTLHVFERE